MPLLLAEPVLGVFQNVPGFKTNRFFWLWVIAVLRYNVPVPRNSFIRGFLRDLIARKTNGCTHVIKRERPVHYLLLICDDIKHGARSRCSRWQVRINNACLNDVKEFDYIKSSINCQEHNLTLRTPLLPSIDAAVSR